MAAAQAAAQGPLPGTLRVGLRVQPAAGGGAVSAGLRLSLFGRDGADLAACFEAATAAQAAAAAAETEAAARGGSKPAEPPKAFHAFLQSRKEMLSRAFPDATPEACDGWARLEWARPGPAQPQKETLVRQQLTLRTEHRDVLSQVRREGKDHFDSPTRSSASNKTRLRAGASDDDGGSGGSDGESDDGDGRRGGAKKRRPSVAPQRFAPSAAPPRGDPAAAAAAAFAKETAALASLDPASTSSAARRARGGTACQSGATRAPAATRRRPTTSDSRIRSTRWASRSRRSPTRCSR